MSTPRKTPVDEMARDPVGKPIDLSMGVVAWMGGIGEINDGLSIQIAAAIDKVTKILPTHRRTPCLMDQLAALTASDNAADCSMRS